ncbi:unnamed protein product, partial [Rotaria sp. Silwood2]
METQLDHLEEIKHIESDQHNTDDENSEENVSSQSSCLTSSSSRKSSSSGDGLYELNYKQEKAKEKLTRIFEALDLPPVHDQFQSTENQARQAVILRDQNRTLVYPEYSTGNKPLSNNITDTVVKFYREDGISRISSKSKDIIQINKNPVTLRFMEMTTLEAFRIFQERFPNTVSQPAFYSLRPRDVKISSPHDT